MAEVVAGDTHAGGVPVASAAAVDGVVPPVEQVAGDRDVGDAAEVGGEVHAAGLVVRVEDRVVPDDVVAPAVLLHPVVVRGRGERQVMDVGVLQDVVVVHLDAVLAPGDVQPVHDGAVARGLDRTIAAASPAGDRRVLDREVRAGDEVHRVDVRGRDAVVPDRHIGRADRDRAGDVLALDHRPVGGHGDGAGRGEAGAVGAGVGGVREAARMRAGDTVGVPGDRATTPA